MAQACGSERAQRALRKSHGDALADKISPAGADQTRVYTEGSMPAPTEPSPEAGMNIMRKAVAKNDLAKLKNRRKRIRSDRSMRRRSGAVPENEIGQMKLARPRNLGARGTILGS